MGLRKQLTRKYKQMANEDLQKRVGQANEYLKTVKEELNLEMTAQLSVTGQGIIPVAAWRDIKKEDESPIITPGEDNA